jgi:hypothetical protein
MEVIKQEHDTLTTVLRRYQATGTADALIAEVSGGWAGTLGLGHSPVSATSDGLRRLTATFDPFEDERATDGLGSIGDGVAGNGVNGLRRYRLIPERSVVLIEVRSTVGPISFGAVGVTGWIDAAIGDGVLRTDIAPAAHIEFLVSGLRSGNRVYDAELLRRVDADRFPVSAIDLTECVPVGPPGKNYRLSGGLAFHGVSRSVEGTVSLDATKDRRVVITGEQIFDMRDFSIRSPTVLMLRIYPDVRVRLHAEAEPSPVDEPALS